MKIIVYTKTNCGWCAEVLDLLLEYNIPFEERNVSESREFMKEMIDKSDQSLAPTLDIGGEILADAGADEVEAYLKEKGVMKGF